ncbi:hypothetical protein V2J09_018241 [Rumex salicifolius]
MGLVPSVMGLPMGLPSFMGSGTGMPSSPMLGLVMGTLYSKFLEKEITEFEQFQVIILDIFNTFNSALPGKHYDVPSRKEVEECYERWRRVASSHERKQVFINFMKKNVGLSTLDDFTLITGLVTPPVAMAAKKAGESVPQLKLIKMVPDVVFVPTITVIALVSAKLSRRMFVKNIASSES